MTILATGNAAGAALSAFPPNNFYVYVSLAEDQKIHHSDIIQAFKSTTRVDDTNSFERSNPLIAALWTEDLPLRSLSFLPDASIPVCTLRKPVEDVSPGCKRMHDQVPDEDLSTNSEGRKSVYPHQNLAFSTPLEMTSATNCQDSTGSICTSVASSCLCTRADTSALRLVAWSFSAGTRPANLRLRGGDHLWKTVRQTFLSCLPVLPRCRQPLEHLSDDSCPFIILSAST